jgi:hypothetical protein
MSVLLSLVAYTNAGARQRLIKDAESRKRYRNQNGQWGGHLPDVKGSIIYAGKKTEVIMLTV